MEFRKEIIQTMYDYIANNELDVEFRKICNEVDEKIKDVVTDKQLEDIDGLLCDLDYAAFFLGANTVLDFISGKEVAAV